MHVRLVDGQRGAFDLVGEAGVVAIIIAYVGGLTGGLGQKLSAVGGLDAAKMRGVFLN